MKKVLLYIDESEKYADINIQKSDLMNEVKNNHWHLIGTFFDKEKQSTFIQQAKDYYIFLNEKKMKSNFDLIIVWDIKLIWKNISNFFEMLEWLKLSKIDIYFHNQSINTSEDNGLLYKYAKIFSETEKRIKSERILNGLSKVKSEGKKLGRPEKDVDHIKILKDRDQKLTIREIAKRHKLSVGKIHYLINRQKR